MPYLGKIYTVAVVATVVMFLLWAVGDRVGLHVDVVLVCCSTAVDSGSAAAVRVFCLKDARLLSCCLLNTPVFSRVYVCVFLFGKVRVLFEIAIKPSVYCFARGCAAACRVPRRSIQRIGDSLKKDTSKGGKTGTGFYWLAGKQVLF